VTAGGAAMLTPNEARAVVLAVDEKTAVQSAPAHLAFGRALAADVDAALGLVDGATLTPPRLALLAERRLEPIPTHPPAGVGLVTIDPEFDGEAKTPAAAAAGLAAAINRAGQIPVDVGSTPPDDELHAAALGRIFEMAEIACTLGARPGDAAMVAARLGGEVKFAGVAQTPGGELAFAALDDGWWFGLPAAPGEALVCFEFYVRPLARKLAGHRDFDLPTLEAPFAAPPPASDGWRLAWAKIIRGAAPMVQILTGGSNPLAIAAQADGLVLLPPGAAPERATLHVTK